MLRLCVQTVILKKGGGYENGSTGVDRTVWIVVAL